MRIFKCCVIFIIILQLREVRMASSEDHESFENFKLKYSKKYINDDEQQQRFKIFLQNTEIIKNQNFKHVPGTFSYKMAINEYADMTPEEFEDIHWTRYADDIGDEGTTFIPPFNVLPPNSIDWHQLGAVTPVKKQLKCGSCWAFAATGALEGQHFRKTSQLISLSEQNLIDCTLEEEYGNNGCRGGFKENAFIYARDNVGIATAEAYPYQARENPQCNFNASTIGAIGTGFVVLPEVALTIAVGTVGPISVALHGKCLRLQFYKEGIYDDVDCGPTAPLKHSVLIVGYGRDNVTDMDYWLIKNCWGPNWGMNGYVKIPRFQNYAAVANRASYPLV